MTSIPAEPTPARTRTELVSPEFVREAEVLGLKTSDAIALGELLLGTIALDADTAPLFKGGRALCAELLEQGLRASPDGSVAYRKGRDAKIDDSIRLVVEAQFPTPTKTVRNELRTTTGYAIWYSEADVAWYGDDPKGQAHRAESAAEAAATFADPLEADAIYPDVLALRNKPVLVVPIDDGQAGR